MVMVRLKQDVTLTDGTNRTFQRGTTYFLGETVSINGGREWRYVLLHWDGSVAMRIRPEWVEVCNAV